jgi:hypothetical protein
MSFNTEKFTEWLAVWPDFNGAKKTWQIGPFPEETALRFFNSYRVLSDTPMKEPGEIHRC